CAVRPGEAVAPAPRERRGDVVEEDLRPVPHGHTLNSNHGITPGLQRPRRPATPADGQTWETPILTAIRRRLRVWRRGCGGRSERAGSGRIRSPARRD